MNTSRRHSHSNFAHHIVIHWSLFRVLIESLHYYSHQRETIGDKWIFVIKLVKQWKSNKCAKFEFEWLLVIFIYSTSKFEVQTRTSSAGTSGLIPKRKCLKFLTLHSPFTLLSEKKYSNWMAVLSTLKFITLDETIRSASKWFILP